MKNNAEKKNYFNLLEFWEVPRMDFSKNDGLCDIVYFRLNTTR